MQEGPRFFDMRAPEITEKAVRAMSIPEVMAALDEIGGGKVKLRSMYAYEVGDVLRQAPTAKVTEAVHRLLRRWDHTGVLAAQVDIAPGQ